jgi:zinc transporter ZupT
MHEVLIPLAIITSLFTLIGGAVAIKFRRLLKYFFAFAAGSLISVTFFDILPESLNLAESVALPDRYLMIVLVLVFLFYSLIERHLMTHHSESHTGGHVMGPIGATGLVVHSLFDGIAIGAAFQVNAHVGIIVALAVIFHDFTDGINTVTVMLKNRHNVRRAAVFLIADAVAPIVGVIITLFVILNPTLLALVLAAFAGEFLYIGATNLLPETYKFTHGPVSLRMTAAMIAGVAIIFILTSVV